MVAEGADLLDVGGESTRPGHADGRRGRGTARVVPVVAALRAALPDMPLSIDTTKPAVAEAALAAGADLVNDVWGVGADDAPGPASPPRTASRSSSCTTAPSRATTTSSPRSSRTCAARSSGRVAAGVPAERLIVDPGFGFGKTPEHNLALLRDLGAPARAGPARSCSARPASRRSGKVLDLPAEERLEATLATTALGHRGRRRTSSASTTSRRTSARPG